MLGPSGLIADFLEPRLRGLRSMIFLDRRQALSTCAHPGGFRRFARSASAYLGRTLAAVLSCGLATVGAAATKPRVFLDLSADRFRVADSARAVRRARVLAHAAELIVLSSISRFIVHACLANDRAFWSERGRGTQLASPTLGDLAKDGSNSPAPHKSEVAIGSPTPADLMVAGAAKAR